MCKYTNIYLSIYLFIYFLAYFPKTSRSSHTSCSSSARSCALYRIWGQSRSFTAIGRLSHLPCFHAAWCWAFGPKPYLAHQIAEAIRPCATTRRLSPVLVDIVLRPGLLYRHSTKLAQHLEAHPGVVRPLNFDLAITFHFGAMHRSSKELSGWKTAVATLMSEQTTCLRARRDNHVRHMLSNSTNQNWAGRQAASKRQQADRQRKHQTTKQIKIATKPPNKKQTKQPSNPSNQAKQTSNQATNQPQPTNQQTNQPTKQTNKQKNKQACKHSLNFSPTLWSGRFRSALIKKKMV